MAPKRLYRVKPSPKSRLISAANRARWAKFRQQHSETNHLRHKAALSSQDPMREDQRVYFQSIGDKRRNQKRMKPGTRRDKCFTDIAILTAGTAKTDNAAMTNTGMKSVSAARPRCVTATALVAESSNKFMDKMRTPSQFKIVKHTFDGTPMNVKDEESGAIVRKEMVNQRVFARWDGQIDDCCRFIVQSLRLDCSSGVSNKVTATSGY